MDFGPGIFRDDVTLLDQVSFTVIYIHVTNHVSILQSHLNIVCL